MNKNSSTIIFAAVAAILTLAIPGISILHQAFASTDGQYAIGGVGGGGGQGAQGGQGGRGGSPVNEHGPVGADANGGE